MPDLEAGAFQNRRRHWNPARRGNSIQRAASRFQELRLHPARRTTRELFQRANRFASISLARRIRVRCRPAPRRGGRRIVCPCEPLRDQSIKRPEPQQPIRSQRDECHATAVWRHGGRATRDAEAPAIWRRQRKLDGLGCRRPAAQIGGRTRTARIGRCSPRTMQRLVRELMGNAGGPLISTKRDRQANRKVAVAG